MLNKNITDLNWHSKTYNKFGRNIASALDNSTKAVYIYDVATSRISSMSTFNTNFGINSMNNNNLQSRITYQCAVNKIIVVANGNSLNSSTSNTLNNSITATSNLPPKSSILTENIASLNPFRFSSEYHDSTLGLVYYNYRHYNPNDGRWLSRDPIAEKGGYNLYGMVRNNTIDLIDFNGLLNSNMKNFNRYEITFIEEKIASGYGGILSVKG